MSRNNNEIRNALGFDDVLLQPRHADFNFDAIDLSTKLSKDITLKSPLISAPSDTVTEDKMAILMAQLGGIGVIHHHMPASQQGQQIRRVKRYESGMVTSPITITIESSLAEAMDLMKKYEISGIPVINDQTRKLTGIITYRDIRFTNDLSRPVTELMTKNVITVPLKTDHETAKKLMHKHRIERLVVVDDQHKCVGMMHAKDMDRVGDYPNASRDKKGRLLVAASVGTGKEHFDRASILIDSEVDAIFIDAVHGHSKHVMDMVTQIRRLRSSNVQVIAGNVVTAEAARALIDAGVDGVKVGMGVEPKSPSRLLTGVGMPHITAIMDVHEACAVHNIPVIASGGIYHPGEAAKALAAGAHTIMIDTPFAGTSESPGKVMLLDGRSYKIGNASSKNRSKKTLYKGAIAPIVSHLLDGIRTSMVYTGCKDLDALHKCAEFIRVTPHQTPTT